MPTTTRAAGAGGRISVRRGLVAVLGCVVLGLVALLAAMLASLTVAETRVLVAAAVLAVPAGLVYARSLHRHPWRRCRRCNASGRHEDTTVFKGTSGRCVCCARSGNRGWHVRPGVRIFTPARARALAGGRTGRYG